MHSRRPPLTAAFIVRDQAPTLGRAIDSARDYVAEVVVRDTGSTDGSPEVAIERGARVLRGAWHDDFARARNQLLAACTTEWVLMLDADEQLVSGGDALKSLLRQPARSAFQVDIESEVDLGRAELTRAVRIFRRSPATRFRCRVHELLEGVGDADPSPIRVVHHGFAGSRRREKCIRNLALLDLELRERPDGAYLHWRRGRELELLGQTGMAHEAWERAADILLGREVIELARHGWIVEALADWAEALEGANQLARALPLATRAVLAQPARPLARYVHARALAAAGRLDHARRATHHLLEPRGWRFELPGEDELLTRHAPELLARLRQTHLTAV